MKLFHLFISICILSLTTTAFAADEVKPGGVDKPKVAEKSEAGIKLGSVDLPQVAEKSEAGAKALVTLKEMYDKFQVTLKTKEKELDKLRPPCRGRISPTLNGRPRKSNSRRSSVSTSSSERRPSRNSPRSRRN